MSPVLAVGTVLAWFPPVERNKEYGIISRIESDTVEIFWSKVGRQRYELEDVKSWISERSAQPCRVFSQLNGK